MTNIFLSNALAASAASPTFLCWADSEISAIEIGSIKCFNCGRRRNRIFHLNEGKATGSAGIAIHDHIDPCHFPVLRKYLRQHFIRC